VLHKLQAICPIYFGFAEVSSGARGVPLKVRGGRKLRQACDQPCLRHIDRDELAAIVNGNGVADEIWVNGDRRDQVRSTFLSLT